MILIKPIQNSFISNSESNSFYLTLDESLRALKLMYPYKTGMIEALNDGKEIKTEDDIRDILDNYPFLIKGIVGLKNQGKISFKDSIHDICDEGSLNELNLAA